MITPAYAPTATERVLPRMALDFTTASLDSRVTITRALNTATAINSSGYIATVNANLPRFDYDPTTLLCKGLLIEESRPNLAIDSSNLSTVSWTLLRALNTQPSGTSPDNTNSANLLVDTAVSGTHVAIQLFTKAASAIAYSASVYLKAGVRTKGEFRMSDQAGNGTRVIFDLTAGTVETPTLFGTGFTLGAASRVAMPNGWYRVILTTTSNTAVTLGLELYIALDNLSISYVGNGSGFYVWGAQVEAGAFATSYIPTTTTSLTRNADEVKMTGTNFSSWYNATEGALTVECVAPVVSATAWIAVLWDGTAANRMRFQYNSGTQFISVVSGATQVSLDVGTFTANTKSKICMAYKNNSYALAIDGGAAGTSPGSVPSVTEFLIGGAAGVYINGLISKINYYPQRLTNAEVVAFSK